MSDYLMISAIEMFVGLMLLVCPLLVLTRLPQWLGKPEVIRVIFVVVGLITGIGGLLACWNTLQKEGVLVLFRGSIELLLTGHFLMVCPKEMLGGLCQALERRLAGLEQGIYWSSNRNDNRVSTARDWLHHLFEWTVLLSLRIRTNDTP